MREITHKHAGKPRYQAKNNQYLTQWDEDAIDHAVFRADYRPLWPVVFDIETTAENPQRPILITAYDSNKKCLTICYDSTRGYEPDKEALETQIRRDFGFELRNGPNGIRWVPYVSHNAVERYILRSVADRPNTVLVAHNMLFDLGITGKPTPDIFDYYDFEINNGCIKWADLYCRFQRAGAFGRFYKFFCMQSGDWGGQSPIDVELRTCDTQTLAQSLHLPSKLSDVADIFGIETVETDTHGSLSDDYVRYNVSDVNATWRVYRALRDELHTAFNTDKSPASVYSTASIGKDVLERMGYDRVAYSNEAADVIPKAYFGGRTEALKAGQRVDDAAYLDVLSQYPTVCGITGVWDAMTAERVDLRQVGTNQLPTCDLSTLTQYPTAWADCAGYYVALSADGATLPVRTDLRGGGNTRVYNAQVTHDEGERTLYHYFDVLAAELLGARRGEDFEIKAAFETVITGSQDLSPTTVGDEEIRPQDNVMLRAIELRKSKQQENRNNGIALPDGKNSKTKALKILANSLYGIAAERVVREVGEMGTDGHERYDTAGKYYNPHVAAVITAGGRLQLAIGEAVAQDAGGDLYYCDTDSLIVDESVSDDVIEAFSNLNPYGAEPVASAPVLEVETGGDDAPLSGISLFAVGVKKYAILRDNEIVKFTEHGLGHFDFFRKDGISKRFWIYLLKNWYNQPVVGDSLKGDDLRDPLFWQQGATTESVRATVGEYFDQQVRFGDWIERAVPAAGGDQSVYLGPLGHDHILRIDVGVDGAVTAEIVERDDADLRTVTDFASVWYADAQKRAELGRRPAVLVTGHETVTKESQTELQAWIERVQLLCDSLAIGWLID